jgi:NADH:ubiquinone oxidoreductase subunit 6 (subunit J)
LPRVAIPAVLATLVAFGFLAFGVLHTPLAPTTPHAASLGPVGTANVFGSVADFGVALFTVQLLPFEVTAFILMVAVIGVVLLAGDASPQKTRGSHEKSALKSAGREPIVKAGR